MNKTIYITLSIALWGSVCQIAAEARTSETDARLKSGLKKYPQADTNKDGVLTMEEARAFKAKMKTGHVDNPGHHPQPDHIDIAYGDHPKQTFDLWLADSETPTPLLICIHGGGFKGGDKAKYHRDPVVKSMLDQGISVATINYRLTEGGKYPYPIPMHDSARAIQQLRNHAEKYNLDRLSFAATGGSAGGCISLWLAFHDDLGNPGSNDPIARESSRLLAVAPNGAQTTLNFNTMKKIFQSEDLQEHKGFRPLFALPEEGEVEMTSELRATMNDASPVTHLSKDDPAVFLTYNGKDVPVDGNSSPGVYVHHPKMGMFLQEKMEKLNMECYLQYSGGPNIKPYANSTEFLIEKLKQ